MKLKLDGPAVLLVLIIPNLRFLLFIGIGASLAGLVLVVPLLSRQKQNFIFAKYK